MWLFWVSGGPVHWRLGPPTAGRFKGMLAFAQRLVAPLDTILVGGGVAAAPRCQGIATRMFYSRAVLPPSTTPSGMGMASSGTHPEPGSGRNVISLRQDESIASQMLVDNFQPLCLLAFLTDGG